MTKKVTTNKVPSTLVERILAKSKGGDESKLVRFDEKLVKYFDKQARSREEQIDNKEEKIIDAKEALQDIIDGADLSKLSTIGSVENYLPDYVNAVRHQLAVIKNLEEDIELLNEEINQIFVIKDVIYSLPE